MKRWIASAAALMAVSAGAGGAGLLAAHAHDYASGALEIGHPWVKPPLGGRDMTAGYLSVTNTGDAPDRLIGASAAGVSAIELHTHIKDGEIMRMRKVEGFDVPAGETLTLEPGGPHLMLFGVSDAWSVGDMMPVTLTFETAGDVPVDLAVETMAPLADTGDGAASDMSGDHAHHH